jgi:hypothetical protein
VEGYDFENESDLINFCQIISSLNNELSFGSEEERIERLTRTYKWFFLPEITAKNSDLSIH